MSKPLKLKALARKTAEDVLRSQAKPIRRLLLATGRDRAPSMPEIVQKCRRDGQRCLFRGDALLGRKVTLDLPHATDETRHHMGSADRVREPRVIGAGVGERRQPELPDASESLHLVRLHQAGDDGKFGRFERDQAVDGVAKDHRMRARFAGRDVEHQS